MTSWREIAALGALGRRRLRGEHVRMSSAKTVAALVEAMKRACDIDKAMTIPRVRAQLMRRAAVEPETRRHIEEWAAARGYA